MKLEEYMSKINDPNAMIKSKFQYTTTRWSAINDEAKMLVKDFENKYISRSDVIEAYREYFSGTTTDWRRAFTLTMIWGFADTGYGAHRTEKYLNGKNYSHIKEALAAVKAKNLKTAFILLSKIDGLGISYISKVLYFATRAEGQDEYALIFDIRVARALIKILAPIVYGILKIYPSPKYRNYAKYNNLMHTLAKQYGTSAESLELFLFNLADDKRYSLDSEHPTEDSPANNQKVI
ncbi:hypothetical protein SAMN05216436_1418 [bacterium A37T11]|nr:hypothetical protein SAMN05216436_1418 [bacterium A37T11]